MVCTSVGSTESKLGGERGHGVNVDLSSLNPHYTYSFSDEEKLEFEWNTGTNVDTKKVISNFPVDLSDYPKSLQMYANGVLDQRLPQTDMTFRHMGSKLIVVSTNQSIIKYMVLSANYTLNPELGEGEYLKMEKKHSCRQS